MAPRVTYTQVEAGKKRFTVVQMSADTALQALMTKLQQADPEGKYFLRLPFEEQTVKGRVTKVACTAKGAVTLTADGNGSDRQVLVAAVEDLGSTVRLARGELADNEAILGQIVELQRIMREQEVYSTACLFDVVNLLGRRPMLVNYSTLRGKEDGLLDWERNRNRFDIVLLAYNIAGELMGNVRSKDDLRWYGLHYKALLGSRVFSEIKETIIKCSAGSEHRQVIEDVLANLTYGNTLHYIHVVFRVADAIWKVHDSQERLNAIQAFDPAFTRQPLLVRDSYARELLSGW